MPSSKKASSTSKTAHVMNLLSKSGAAPAEGSETPVEEGQAPAAPAPAPAPAAKSPIIVSLSSDAQVSEQIRDALEDALEQDEAASPAPQVSPEPTEAEEAAEAAPEPPAPEAAAEAAPEPPAPEAAVEVSPEPPAPEAAAEAAPEPPAPEEAAETAPEPPKAEEAPAGTATQPSVPEMPAPLTPAASDSPITCVNVMQVLVDENAEKYVKMFGLCECPHCMADVKALALNNLQPKYVVMENGHVVPRISVYEGRYQAAVTAQILRACTTVMEQPRHQRPV